MIARTSARSKDVVGQLGKLRAGCLPAQPAGGQPAAGFQPAPQARGILSHIRGLHGMCPCVELPTNLGLSVTPGGDEHVHIIIWTSCSKSCLNTRSAFFTRATSSS